MPGSLKEALRQALEEDDAREKDEGAYQTTVIPTGNVIETTPIVETAERSEMTFEEQAGELIPQEVGE